MEGEKDSDGGEDSRRSSESSNNAMEIDGVDRVKTDVTVIWCHIIPTAA